LRRDDEPAAAGDWQNPRGQSASSVLTWLGSWSADFIKASS